MITYAEYDINLVPLPLHVTKICRGGVEKIWESRGANSLGVFLVCGSCQKFVDWKTLYMFYVHSNTRLPCGIVRTIE